MSEPARVYAAFSKAQATQLTLELAALERWSLRKHWLAGVSMLATLQAIITGIGFWKGQALLGAACGAVAAVCGLSVLWWTARQTLRRRTHLRLVSASAVAVWQVPPTKKKPQQSGA